MDRCLGLVSLAIAPNTFMLTQTAVPGSEKEIAIIDDDPQDCVHIDRCLRQGNGSLVRTEFANSFEEGLSLLSERSFDTALVDVDLGGRSGLDLVERFGGRLSPTPFIIIGGRDGRDLDERAADLGAYAFLEKADLTDASLDRAIRYTSRARASERALQAAAQKAVATTDAKNAFLARMSHDFRTPLNAIMGFAELLEAEAGSRLSVERTVEYAGYIMDSSRHLMDLVNNILNLSRIEAGRYEIRRIWLDVGEVLPQMVRLVADAAARKRIDLWVRTGHGAHLLAADSTALKQMVVNLLSNAVKFTPEGGRIAIETAATAGTFSLTVRDTGIGMDADEVEIALTPYSQLSRPFDTAQEGSGLGLAIVKSLVEAHGGRLAIDSVPGQGTAATLAFPLNAMPGMAIGRAAE